MSTAEATSKTCLNDWPERRVPEPPASIAGRGRGSERRFCGAECRQQHHTAVRKLGSHVAADRFGSPGELSGWLEKACTPREETKLVQEASTPVEDAPARPERAYGFRQHGMFWYVVDPEGQRVSDPLKAAVQAQRLARQMSAGVAKNP